MISHLSEFFEGANRSWGIIRSDFRTPAPPMYMYRHDWISIDNYELVVTFVVTWPVLIGRNRL